MQKYYIEGGTCDIEFKGETMEEVAGKGGQHIMTTTDEGHKPMKDQMQNRNNN